MKIGRAKNLCEQKGHCHATPGTGRGGKRGENRNVKVWGKEGENSFWGAEKRTRQGRHPGVKGGGKHICKWGKTQTKRTQGWKGEWVGGNGHGGKPVEKDTEGEAKG